MKRPVILVDLDNVVYDWAKSMAQWLVKNDAISLPESDPDIPMWWMLSRPQRAMRSYRTWSVWEDWGIPKGEFIRWWRLGIEAGEIYGQGPLIAGSRTALWQLSDAEWHIHIATSRLTKFGLHDLIVENTSRWLRDNNIPYRSISFTDAKQRIKAEAIVDDRADNMGPMHQRRFHFPANHNEGRYVTAAEQREAWQDIVTTLS